MRRLRIRRIIAIATTVLVAIPATPQGLVGAAAARVMKIKVLSNRADLISGGNAYMQIVLPRNASAGQLEVRVGRRDISGAFAKRRDGRVLGLVRGLRKGRNLLTAELPDGRGAQITIRNHAKGGPIFSGKQVRPWICQTRDSGLKKARGKKCNAPTLIEYFYQSNDPSKPGFQSYDRDTPPSDVATTTTDQGKEVPFIVRRETGTQNRGVYQIAVLYNPKKKWKPWASQSGWNHKLVYPFGVSCGTEHRQAEPVDVMHEDQLGRGFMIANSSLNVLGNNCNTVTSAESVVMLKERIVEKFGEIRYTIGEGCSGGSIGQHMVANNYPGLLQGIQPNCSYEDIYSTGNEVVDCHLLVHYFNETSPHLWPDGPQRAAVSGHQGESTCLAWEALFASVPDPKTGCALPEEKQYHPQDNPRGARCTTQDFQIAMWGRRPRRIWTKVEKKIHRGFADVPFDNTGWQYGLNALNSELITPEQFVDLNEKIGGVTIDFEFQAKRTKSTLRALRILHRTGQMNSGNHLDRVAIIDLRGTSNNEIHTDFHSWAMRQRLDRANGHHDNQIIWTFSNPLVPPPNVADAAFDLLDRWLTAVEADDSTLSLATKIVRNKPADAVDSCFIGEERVTDPAACRAAFPYFGAPRIAAGGPPTHDVSKCVLKALERSAYEVSFTDGQWDRLKKAFPNGVCDFNRPPIARTRAIPWMSFAGGPGGKPLRAAPRSRSYQVIP